MNITDDRLSYGLEEVLSEQDENIQLESRETRENENGTENPISGIPVFTGRCVSGV